MQQNQTLDERPKTDIPGSRLRSDPENWRIRAEGGVQLMLEALGHDVTREGLLDTPRRFVDYILEFSGRKEEPRLTTFKDESSEMVVQTQIPFTSICEHHLLPFHGKATIGYIPKGRMVGLSKFARVLEFFSRRLQNQERITHQVASYFFESPDLKPSGVGVILMAHHTCMSCRGARAHGSNTTTTVLKGAFTHASTKQEFFLHHSNG